MSTSTNELFSRELLTKISKLLNIDEEVVSTVWSATILHILKDCSIQSDKSSYVTIHIPRIADINVSLTPKKYITIDSVYLYPKFKDQLKNAMSTDDDILFDSILKGTGALIVSKFLKVLDDDDIIEGD